MWVWERAQNSVFIVFLFVFSLNNWALLNYKTFYPYISRYFILFNIKTCIKCCHKRSQKTNMWIKLWIKVLYLSWVMQILRKSKELMLLLQCWSLWAGTVGHTQAIQSLSLNGIIRCRQFATPSTRDFVDLSTSTITSTIHCTFTHQLLSVMHFQFYLYFKWHLSKCKTYTSVWTFKFYQTLKSFKIHFPLLTCIFKIYLYF